MQLLTHAIIKAIASEYHNLFVFNLMETDLYVGKLLILRGHQMDMDNPAVLFSGIIIGAIGMGLFVYGRKSSDLQSLGLGVIFSILPFFAHTLLVIWGISGLCASLAYISRRFA